MTYRKAEKAGKKEALSILLRFKAMTERRHSSVTAGMPLFLILDRQCSLFRTEKLPSAQIFRRRIIERYEGVATRLCPLKKAG